MPTNPAPNPCACHDEVLRQGDVAGAWKVTTRTIRNWLADEKWTHIPPPRHDAGGKPYWIRSEVMALIVASRSGSLAAVTPPAPSIDDAAVAAPALSASDRELLELMNDA